MEKRWVLALAISLCLMVPLLSAAKLKITPEGKEDTLSLYWEAMDANSDDSVTITEMSRFASRAYGHKTSIAQIQRAINKLDVDLDGRISRNEFFGKYGIFFAPMSSSVPQQLHLALTGTKSEMRITWVTRGPVNQPIAKYGTTGLTQSVPAVTSTYQEGTFVPWVGWIHTAVMTDLAPGVAYQYSVGSLNGPFSDVKIFKSQTSSPQDATIALFGDMGTIMPFGFEVAFQIAQDNHVTPYDLVVHAGDIAYGGTGHSWEFEFFWDLFGRQTEPFASVVPYMTAVGNHEHYFNYTAFNARYQMPSQASGGYKNFWLSFDHSYAHWIFMSTEHDYTPGSEQHNFLVRDLEKATMNRQNVPWIFLVGHRPLYCSDTSEYDMYRPGAPLSNNIEPLLMHYGVDVYWGGHQHMYERLWPNINGTNVLTFPDNRYYNPKRPTYVTQGTGGAFIGNDWIQPRPAWSAFREQQYGYGRLTLNRTSFHYEYVSTDTASVRDEFWLTK